MRGEVRNVFGVYYADGGGMSDNLYHMFSTREQALAETKGSGYASIRELRACIDEKGHVYLLTQTDVVLDEGDEQKRRRKALSRLTVDERRLLGLPDP